MARRLPASLQGRPAANAPAAQAGLPAANATAAQAGGFDCVVGNPPYIRQEWLSPCKPNFEREFRSYAGTADAYLYFMRGAIPDSIADAVVPDGSDCDASVLTRSEWRFQPAAVNDLLDRIMACGRTLDGVVAGRIYCGVLTGLNAAFSIDQATRDHLARRRAQACGMQVVWGMMQVLRIEAVAW